jgi:hypothetical protein
MRGLRPTPATDGTLIAAVQRGAWVVVRRGRLRGLDAEVIRREATARFRLALAGYGPGAAARETLMAVAQRAIEAALGGCPCDPTPGLIA